jgi:hypothetical protein
MEAMMDAVMSSIDIKPAPNETLAPVAFLLPCVARILRAGARDLSVPAVPALGRWATARCCAAPPRLSPSAGSI